MALAEELRKTLYDRGEFDKCLAAVKLEPEIRLEGGPERGELLALGGWCYYRKGDYETARKWFQNAGPVNFAREGLTYLAAYIDKDDVELRKLVQELGDRVNTRNALVIRARDPDSTVSGDEVMESVLRFREDTVEVANLCHNAGRFFFEKGKSDKDLLIALGLLEAALVRYGIDRNWHHRGAANFWKSRVLERLYDKRAALEAARESLYCWTQQVILDPGTERHRKQWENAAERQKQLLS